MGKIYDVYVDLYTKGWAVSPLLTPVKHISKSEMCKLSIVKNIVQQT